MRAHVLFAAAMLALAPLAQADATALDAAFGSLNGLLARIIFFDVWPGDPVMPFIVAWLGTAAAFLTVRFGFINLRMMRHAFRVIRGRYRTADDQGEVSSFQALSTALSATVGLGNIAGVAVAVTVGGPGATFWMGAGVLPPTSWAKSGRIGVSTGPGPTSFTRIPRDNPRPASCIV